MVISGSNCSGLAGTAVTLSLRVGMVENEDVGVRVRRFWWMMMGVRVYCGFTLVSVVAPPHRLGVVRA